MSEDDDEDLEEPAAGEDNGEIAEGDWITGPVKAVVAVGKDGERHILTYSASDAEWVDGPGDCESDTPDHLGHIRLVTPHLMPESDLEWLEEWPLGDSVFAFGCPQEPGIWLLTVRFYDSGGCDWDWVELEPPRLLASLPDLLAGKPPA